MHIIPDGTHSRLKTTGKAKDSGLTPATNQPATKLYLTTVSLPPMNQVLIRHNPYGRRPGAAPPGRALRRELKLGSSMGLRWRGEQRHMASRLTSPRPSEAYPAGCAESLIFRLRSLPASSLLRLSLILSSTSYVSLRTHCKLNYS
jgi:hypothetical protein